MPKTILPREHAGFHREIYYEVRKDPVLALWRYSFTVGKDTKGGTVNAALGLLAVRRVRTLIDKALRAAGRT